MRAAVMVDRNKIEYQEIPTPSIEEDEILIRVHAIGVCGTDWQFLRGLREVKFPYLSGHEASGEIISMGSAVRDFSIGDKVVIDPNFHCGRCFYCRHGRFNLCTHKRVLGVSIPGCFAECVKVPQENAWKLPPSFPYWKGALIEPISVASHVRHQANIELGEKVIVFGAGMIGLTLVQLLKMSGAYVTVVDKFTQKLTIAQKLGADKLIDVSKENLSNALKSGEAFDKVIDAAGIPATFEESLRIAGRGATVIWLGLPTATITIQIFPFMYQELSIRSSLAYNPCEFGDSLALVQNNKIKLESIVTHKLSFEELHKAFDIMETGKAVKVILLFS